MNRSSFAWHSFSILGKEARPAIPELVRIACTPRYRQGGKAAASILIHFQEDGLPGLITILRSPQAPGRRPAIDYFRWTGAAKLGTNANAAAEALVSCLDDADNLTRNDAAVALANLSIRPEVVVSALAKSAADPDTQVRSSSLAALAAYGDSASSAAPAVRKALDDPDPDVRTLAAYALDQVALKSK
jgi:HEAT repeat protein